MNIHLIGSVRGLPHSKSSAEDIAREFAPRFINKGHNFTVHTWWTNDKEPKITYYKGAKVVRHKGPGGKYGQIIINIKSTIYATFSKDCDTILYLWINNSYLCFIPRIFGKKVFANLNGMIWKDPKWPWGLRHIFFNVGAIISYIFCHKVITDAKNMVIEYKKRLFTNIDWIGYGCQKELIIKKEIDLCKKYPDGYFFIMSRLTPHNLTDVLIEGFINSNSKSSLVIAGEVPNTKWFKNIEKRIEGKKIEILGIVENQEYLDQLILNSKAYLHGHSLGGINPALVRVVASDVPSICVDTPFNREVIEQFKGEYNQKLFFNKKTNNLDDIINMFEKDETSFVIDAKKLGKNIRKFWNWDVIFEQYHSLLIKL